MTTMELTLSLVLVLLVCLIARLLLAAAQRKKNNKHAETFNAMNHLHFGDNLSVR